MSYLRFILSPHEPYRENTFIHFINKMTVCKPLFKQCLKFMKSTDVRDIYNHGHIVPCKTLFSFQVRTDLKSQHLVVQRVYYIKPHLLCYSVKNQLIQGVWYSKNTTRLTYQSVCCGCHVTYPHGNQVDLIKTMTKI